MKRRTIKGTASVCEVNLGIDGIRIAASPLARARGLLFAAEKSSGLLLLPCNDVHTVGMGYPLDVAFLDAEGNVVESRRSVGPFRRMRNKRARAVVERRSSCSDPWFAVGDRVSLSVLRKGNQK